MEHQISNKLMTYLLYLITLEDLEVVITLQLVKTLRIIIGMNLMIHTSQKHQKRI